MSYGYDGYTNLFLEKYSFLGKIMKNRIIKWLFNPLYLFFASNRRILAPLKPTESTCKPTLKKEFSFRINPINGTLFRNYNLHKGRLIRTIRLVFIFKSLEIDFYYGHRMVNYGVILQWKK